MQLLRIGWRRDCNVTLRYVSYINDAFADVNIIRAYALKNQIRILMYVILLYFRSEYS